MQAGDVLKLGQLPKYAPLHYFAMERAPCNFCIYGDDMYSFVIPEMQVPSPMAAAIVRCVAAMWWSYDVSILGKTASDPRASGELVPRHLFNATTSMSWISCSDE